MDLRERVINWVLNRKNRLSASQVFKIHYQFSSLTEILDLIFQTISLFKGI